MSGPRIHLKRALEVLRDFCQRPTGHDARQCPTCLVRDQEGYKSQRLVRVHNRASARLWLG